MSRTLIPSIYTVEPGHYKVWSEGGWCLVPAGPPGRYLYNTMLSRLIISEGKLKPVGHRLMSAPKLLAIFAHTTPRRATHDGGWNLFDIKPYSATWCVMCEPEKTCSYLDYLQRSVEAQCPRPAPQLVREIVVERLCWNFTLSVAKICTENKWTRKIGFLSSRKTLGGDPGCKTNCWTLCVEIDCRAVSRAPPTRSITAAIIIILL